MIVDKAIAYVEQADIFDKLKIYMDYIIHSYFIYGFEFIDKDYEIPKGYEDRIKKYDSCIIRFHKSNKMSFDKFINKKVKYKSDLPIIEHLWRFYKRIGIEL